MIHLSTYLPICPPTHLLFVYLSSHRPLIHTFLSAPYTPAHPPTHRSIPQPFTYPCAQSPSTHPASLHPASLHPSAHPASPFPTHSLPASVSSTTHSDLMHSHSEPGPVAPASGHDPAARCQSWGLLGCTHSPSFPPFSVWSQRLRLGTGPSCCHLSQRTFPGWGLASVSPSAFSSGLLSVTSGKMGSHPVLRESRGLPERWQCRS